MLLINFLSQFNAAVVKKINDGLFTVLQSPIIINSLKYFKWIIITTHTLSIDNRQVIYNNRIIVEKIQVLTCCPHGIP